jgi:hypothetical protein
MIIERTEFRLKFGKAKEGIALWKELLEEAKKSDSGFPSLRMLSDLSGPSYTLILEMQLKSFTNINPKNYVWVTTPKFQELYQKFIPLCDSAHRTYLNIEMEV